MNSLVDKKFRTADGLFKVHLLEDETLIFELPKSLIGKDMLIGSSIMGTSDGGDGFAGYLKGKTAEEIEKIPDDGSDADLASMCTIDITDLQKAALRAMDTLRS